MKEIGKKAGSMVREGNLTQKDSWYKKECLKRELLSRTFEEEKN